MDATHPTPPYPPQNLGFNGQHPSKNTPPYPPHGQSHLLNTQNPTSYPSNLNFPSAPAYPSPLSRGLMPPSPIAAYPAPPSIPAYPSPLSRGSVPSSMAPAYPSPLSRGPMPPPMAPAYPAPPMAPAYASPPMAPAYASPLYRGPVPPSVPPYGVFHPQVAVPPTIEGLAPDTRAVDLAPSGLNSRGGTTSEDFVFLYEKYFSLNPLKNKEKDQSLEEYFSQLNFNYFHMGLQNIGAVGGAAEVYKFNFSGQRLALKTVLSDVEIGRNKSHFQAGYAIEQILNEAMVLDELGFQKNIVNIHDYGWFSPDSGPFAFRNFMVIDFIGGGDLNNRQMRQRLQGGERYQVILQVAYEMALALNALHHCGIIHRDIKPHNILWEKNKDKFVLVDFGLAVKYEKKLFGNDPEKAVIGTPAYMSPEQVKAEPLDFRSDEYALGAVLYELLSGKPPHRECHSSYEVLTSVLYNRIDVTQELCKIEELRETISVMTQKDRKKRYQDPNELVDVFKELRRKYR
jgi:hypothetical protein